MDTAPLMNSDVDFQDVFGGPPRRSPASDPNRARADSFDSYSSRERGGGREEGSLYRRRWSGVGDKPVFGDVISPALRRRHHLGDDFFSDIFHASDSPPSRLRSPSGAPRPTESLVGGSSLPAQLRHSMKLGRGGEHSAVNSPTQRPINRYDGFSVPCSPIGNYAASRAIPEQDLRNDLHASYQQSPLSRSAARAVEVRGREGPAWSEGQSRSSRFHFSIYKWAGKGVSLILPSNSEEKIRNGSRLRRLPELVLQGVDVPSSSDMISTVSGASETKNDNQDSKPLKDLTNARKDKKDSTILKDVLPAKFQLKVLQQEITGETEGGKVNMCEEQKPELTNLRQLLADESDSQVGNEDILIQDPEIKGSTKEMNDVFDNLNMEQQDGINHVEVSRLSTQDMQATTLSPENKLPGRTVKGKVKEFIKMFNQEVPLKPKGLSETQERKARGKHGRKSKIDVQANAHTAKTDEEINESSWTDTMSPAPSIAVSQNQKLKEPKSKIRSDAIESHDSSSQRNDDFVPCFELPPESFDTANRNLEESHSGDLDAKVEHLSEEHDGDPQNDLQQDQIQISNVKIREWSKGKEGNIRSLLSTLQYVLWPDSGWKPVPLVDIIEGNSVKRAYQKALLCLHPDKLQQKGAALHQKYTAEKVFDILQEAWTYFNSVTPI